MKLVKKNYFLIIFFTIFKNFLFPKSFPRDKLLRFGNNLRKTFLENYEDIEILRFLELGYKVKLVKMSSKSHPVDVKKDISAVERIIRKKKYNY